MFILLSVIWGSSFILMKIGLDNHLDPFTIAAVRLVAAGLILLPVAVKAWGKIPFRLYPLIFLSGALGSLLPAFLFCVAEQGMDSSLAGMLNSLTPIFVIVTGALFFKRSTPAYKVLGVLIAFTGSLLLLLSKGQVRSAENFFYPMLVLIATIMYGLNVNIVAKYLSHLSPLQVAATALTMNAIPAATVLCFTGFMSLPFHETATIKAIGASVVLGVGGTAVATILFYMLVKRSGGVFASMVTYGIPFVAIGWGLVFGESFGWLQAGCLLIILLGVYAANRKNSR